tara:strand:+ start:21 stop:221 length:201 start_codon:yes stop_codon:yes gene_type:complete
MSPIKRYDTLASELIHEPYNIDNKNLLENIKVSIRNDKYLYDNKITLKKLYMEMYQYSELLSIINL